MLRIELIIDKDQLNEFTEPFNDKQNQKRDFYTYIIDVDEGYEKQTEEKEYIQRIYIDGSKPLDYYLTNPEVIKQAIKSYQDDLFLCDKTKEENKIKPEDLKNIYFIKVVSNTLDEEKATELVNSSEILKKYRVVVPDKVSVLTNIDEIVNKYPGMDILLAPEDGQTEITIEQFKGNIIVGKILNSIKKLNLSPLEELILLYDIIRDKVYTYEENCIYDSRDIYSCIGGNAIVCAGYSNIYKLFCDELGINCINEYLMSNIEDNAGHQRNTVYLDDDKYGVKGIFHLDATSDSKRDENDSQYLYRYGKFLKKYKNFRRDDEEFDLYPETFGIFNDGNDDIGELKKYTDYISVSIPELMSKGIDPMEPLQLNKKYRQTYRALYSLMNEPLSKECPASNNVVKYFKENIEEVINLYRSSLSIDTFLQALVRVKYVESMIDPEKYEFDTKKILESAYESCFKFNVFKSIKYQNMKNRLKQKDKDKQLKKIMDNDLSKEIAKETKKVKEEYKDYDFKGLTLKLY